jgi:Fe2+ or Zn2+ uptake regulation protein
VAAMDQTTFRILDMLWKETGRPVSIHELTSRIRESHGTAYYANIYHKIRELTKEGTITLTKVGRSSIANLNFANYLLIDLLTELELKRKHDLLTKSKELQMLFKDAEERYDEIRSIESISAINAERNLKLNRAELLVLLHDSKDNNLHRKIIDIYAIARDLQALHNIKLDPIILTTGAFFDLLTSDEINPLREMLSSKITFHSPQGFWAHIAAALARGYRIKLLETDTNPAKIHEKDLIFNLARLGYKETGLEIREGEKICIEYIIASMLMKEDARRIDAIPILLVKNKTSYSLLIFLSQKYRLSARLLGLLRALIKIKPMRETAVAIEILETSGTKEIRADEKSIEQKMRLYNAIR